MNYVYLSLYKEYNDRADYDVYCTHYYILFYKRG